MNMLFRLMIVCGVLLQCQGCDWRQIKFEPYTSAMANVEWTDVYRPQISVVTGYYLATQKKPAKSEIELTPNTEERYGESLSGESIKETSENTIVEETVSIAIPTDEKTSVVAIPVAEPTQPTGEYVTYTKCDPKTRRCYVVKTFVPYNVNGELEITDQDDGPYKWVYRNGRWQQLRKENR